jgi:hypothetical protein
MTTNETKKDLLPDGVGIAAIVAGIAELTRVVGIIGEDLERQLSAIREELARSRKGGAA